MSRKRLRKNPPLVVVGNPPRRGRKLSHRVLGITYRHADDGQAYEHTFRPGVEARLNDKTVEIRGSRGQEVWDMFDGQPFLVNPPKRGGGMAGRKKKRRGGKAKRTTVRAAARAARKRRKRPAVRSNPHKAGGTVARRKRRKRSRAVAVARVMRNAPRRARRRGGYRRNPGIMQQVVQVGKDGLAVTGGIVAVRIVAGAAHKAFVGDDPTKEFPGGRLGETALQLGAAVGIAMLGEKFLGREVGRMLGAGAVASIATAAAVKADIPFVSEALTGQFGAYPAALGAYPPPAGISLPNGAQVMMGDPMFPGYSPAQDDDDD